MSSNPQGQITPDDLNADLQKNRLKAAAITSRDILNQLLATLERVDFNKVLDIEQGDQAKQKHVIVLIIETVLNAAQAKKWGLCKQFDFVYCYNGKHWQLIDKEELKAFLGQAAEKMGYSVYESRFYEFREKLYKQFLSAAFLPVPAVDPSRVLINLGNGTFTIAKGKQKLENHNPKDFLRYVLPFGYDEQAQAPNFTKYLERVLPDESSRMVLAEYIGYIFTHNLKLEKMLLLYGSGANGKSVFFEVMNALLGKENISNYSLASLNEEHNRAQIANKLLNYGSEIKSGIDADQLKALASGEPIQARLKYGNSFMMEAYAKLAFNCNELPKEVEHNEAYFRRFLIIPFDQTIPEQERDPYLPNRIIESELAGVFNWVLDGLKRLMKNGRFTECPKVRATLERYRLESDSAWLFMDESGYQPSIDFKPLKELYADYRTFCMEGGFKSVSIRKFSERIRKRGFETEKKNIGQVVFCFKQ